MLNRRHFVAIAAVSAALLSSTSAIAADAHKVGILIPGSKSDKGWMESGYNGLLAAQEKYGENPKNRQPGR